ncbi:MAG TPA: galactokinase family protein [Vicinamibacterales bacterium]|nr:galactokinase family protein [Vicinamibacterales bacterium]
MNAAGGRQAEMNHDRFDQIASHFVALGMAPADAASRAALFEQLESRSAPILEGAAQWRRFTPGRIEIFGKHTDYAGGHSLLAAVPRGIALEARRRDDGVVRVGDVFDGQVIEVDPSTEAPAHYRGLQRYVHVVAHRFFLNFPGCELGANIAIASDLPRASGLSSSSALVVGVALALIDRARLRERDEWQRHLRRIQDLAWYLGCVENGLDFPGLPGSAGVGTHGGSEDHTAILACKTDHVSLYRFVPVTPLAETRMPGDWIFVLAGSGVQADKAGSVMDRYNRASNGVRALHRIWNEHAPEPAPSLADALQRTPDAAEQLRSWLTATPDGAFTAEDLQRRLDHFIRETARAPMALAAFRDGDRDALGRLSDASQREAAELLGNQIPQTILMARLARELGAFAASSFGAGFGGSVWAAVPATEAERFAKEWIGAYERTVPDVGPVPWTIARPGPPATDLPVLQA